MKLIWLMLIAFLIAGCNSNDSEIARLQKENQEMTDEIDRLTEYNKTLETELAQFEDEVVEVDEVDDADEAEDEDASDSDDAE